MDKKTAWLALGLGGAAAAIVGAAVAINLNYQHNGDNASNISGALNIDNGDLKINWERYPTYEVELSDTYTITTSGTYVLSGTLNDGAIVIKAPSDAVVRLVLNGVTIKNSSGPAITCYSADDLVIELSGNNYLEDGKKYSSSYDEDVQGAIYSKSDLSFSGDGKLTLVANYLDGVVGKDDLKINSGTYVITAADDGIRGKDSVYIVGGDFDITAKADAIKSTNETDSTKGYIMIEDGNFAIHAGAKGIKAINSILLYNGNFVINSTDDSIHSNNYVGVMGGEYTISSGDDGIHADARLIIDSGKINIAKSYEGLEAQKISINGGEISIFANDDGINAGGGADSSANNRPGAGMFDVDENCEIVIGGGNVYVNAAGDGIDSNGSTYFNGGEVIVDGPTNNGNGALDAGGSIQMNGGTVIAVGASGMAESLGSSSSVYNASIFLSATQSAGTKIEIRDKSGNTVVSHTSAKTFNHIAVGSESFKYGETYTIYLNGAEYGSFAFDSESMTATVGSGGMGSGQPGQQGQQGQPRGMMR